MKKRVCLLGGGSFGTAVARVVASNLTTHPDTYQPELQLWLRRQELADQINTTNENGQYLPGANIPSNVVANTDLKRVLEGADVIVVGVPHQYISESMISSIREHCNRDAETIHVISLAKGIYLDGEGKSSCLTRVSERLHESLNNTPPAKRLRVDDDNSSSASAPASGQRPKFVISVLMGANVYDQMGRDEFAEATLGCPTMDPIVYKVFNDNDRFNVTMTSDVTGVEFCAVLKNVVALGVGFAVGQDLGSNTKAAIIRRGLKETMKFAKTFGENVSDDTFFESAGIADLMTTCFSGRGQRLAAAFVKEGGDCSWPELEKKVLGGHQIPDWHNVQMVYKFLVAKNATKDFTFFATVYEIGFTKASPAQIVEVLKS